MIDDRNTLNITGGTDVFGGNLDRFPQLYRSLGDSGWSDQIESLVTATAGGDGNTLACGDFLRNFDFSSFSRARHVCGEPAHGQQKKQIGYQAQKRIARIDDGEHVSLRSDPDCSD